MDADFVEEFKCMECSGDVKADLVGEFRCVERDKGVEPNLVENRGCVYCSRGVEANLMGRVNYVEDTGGVQGHFFTDILYPLTSTNPTLVQPAILGREKKKERVTENISIKIITENIILNFEGSLTCEES